MKTQVLNPAKVSPTTGMSVRDQILTSRALTTLSSVISNILDEEITPRQSLSILNVALSFTMLLLLSGSGLPVLCTMFLWFAASVYQCLSSGISCTDR